MNILAVLGTFLINGFVKSDADDDNKRHIGMDKYLVKYWDFYGNYVGTEVCALTSSVALDSVSHRTDCKSLVGWERL